MVAERPERQHCRASGQLGELRKYPLHGTDEYVEIHLSAAGLELQPVLDRRADIKG